MHKKPSSSPEHSQGPSAPRGERELLLAATRLARQLSAVLNDREPALDAVQTIRGEEAVAECFATLRSNCKQDLRVCGRLSLDEHGRIRSRPLRCLPGVGTAVRVEGIYDTVSLREAGVQVRPQDLRVDHREVRLYDGIPFTMVLLDHSAAMVVVEEDEKAVRTALLVRPSQALSIVDSVYQGLWKLASPLQSSGAAVHGSPAEADLRMLEMLADGATDHHVAERLGVSVRTVQRKITELLPRLGAENRFQAGINATKRGWI
ncbi:helix-turn-helix transcriptional regulator [Lentzea flaviverrucosa]|uniref:Regulatory protein, luxR family n=1 Tax=Lentzea flaviverrucosa TaxID=200379 RepID=A0A1H9XS25_9PSEU|nr:helix-turn-helix transcriptional regulator [Lentzea flaviverrucosa]RDI19353.1 regulatory LuxR family protein [Lentzea flaviverrucosa]SES48952.1 regulatory protein, luxR family [Lentzea flaviverrucosa]